MDFAGYSALSGRKNWAQVRQDRLLESQFLRQMQTDLQARIDREAQARAGVQEYMNQLNQTSVLSQDLDRVKGVEEEKRKAIVEGLKKAGNDYNKFLMGNGASLLNSYREDVMKSTEMQNAINNKLVYGQSMLDNYLGRKSAPVTVTLPDGTQKDVSMDEQYKMFDRGEITKLNYSGSVVPTDPIKVYDYISKTYGKDKYRRQAANKEDVMNYAMSMGAPEWEARQIADNYEGELGKGATPVYFKNEEQAVDYGDMINKLKYERMLSGQEPDTGKETGIADIFTQLYKAGEPGFGGQNIFNRQDQNILFDGKMSTANVATNLGADNIAILAKQEGIVKDEKTGMYNVPGDTGIYVYPKKIEGSDPKGKYNDVFQYQIGKNTEIYQLDGFVNMEVPDGNGGYERKTFISGKAKVPGISKNVPVGQYKIEDDKVRILIPTEYNQAKIAQAVKDAGIQKSQESVSGLRSNIDLVNQQQAQSVIDNNADTQPHSILDGGLQNVDQSALTKISSLGYDKVISEIQSDPNKYASYFKSIDLPKLVDTVSEKYKIPSFITSQMISQESGGNPLAISQKGAMGYMQLMPDTAKAYGVTNPFDPVQNTEAGVKLFSELLNTYYKGDINKGIIDGDENAINSIATALAAYNYGSGNVKNLMTTYGDKWYNYLPDETINYINTFGIETGLFK